MDERWKKNAFGNRIFKWPSRKERERQKVTEMVRKGGRVCRSRFLDLEVKN